MYPCKVMASSSIAVMDINSGRILYQNNMNEKKLIASTTKIMTCILILEKGSLNDIVTVGEEVLPMYGTNIYIEVGERISVKDLLYGLMLRSGNDAAIVLATYLCGDEQKFVKMMNEKAVELGMKNTIFENCHGLDENTKNYSTAYDMTLLSKYAYKNRNYRKIINTSKYISVSSLKTYSWYNRMRLLSEYKYCVGGKNGYTPKAGKTLVSVSKKDNLTLTIVSLDDNDIYINHRKIYNQMYNNYKNYLIVDRKTFNIHDESEDKYYLKKSFSYPLSKGEIKNIRTVVSIKPEQKNEIVGSVKIYLDNDLIGNLNIYKKTKKKKRLSFLNKIANYFREIL